jgi:DNA repair photolyase
VNWQRRAGVLTQPKLPCLAAYHALNLTAGCPNECHYCYAQTYAHHPGELPHKKSYPNPNRGLIFGNFLY